MGISTSEKGLLKLVHPGRHLEIYREPIPAAEVMKKYPRHCIARPDVFKFPWVVVKPEAILLPGKVFYIVPYRTIYQLLKDKRQKNQHTPRLHDHNFQGQQEFSYDNYLPSHQLINAEFHHLVDPSFTRDKKNQPKNDQSFKNDRPLKHQENQHSHLRIHTPKHIRASAGTTPKHIHEEWQNSTWYKSRNEEDFSQSLDTPNYHSPSSTKVDSNAKRNGYKSPFLMSSDDRSYSYSGRRHYAVTKNIPRPSNRVYEEDQGSTSTQLELKSCLRKHGSRQRRMNRRVTFASSVFILNQERESPTLQQHDDFAES